MGAAWLHSRMTPLGISWQGKTMRQPCHVDACTPVAAGSLHIHQPLAWHGRLLRGFSTQRHGRQAHHVVPCPAALHNTQSAPPTSQFMSAKTAARLAALRGETEALRYQRAFYDGELAKLQNLPGFKQVHEMRRQQAQEAAEAAARGRERRTAKFAADMDASLNTTRQRKVRSPGGG